MKPIEGGLSARDMKFLERLKRAEVPYWRKPVGYVWITIGVVLLLLHVFGLVAGLVTQIVSTRFMEGLFAILLGGVELQEFRYQRIVRFVLLDGEIKSAVDGNK
jgi:hypothetical protein